MNVITKLLLNEAGFASRWLMKTEPGSLSIDDIIRKGISRAKQFKSPVAQKYVKQVNVGDKIFIYHTGNERQIVGIGTVVTGPYLYDTLYVFDIKVVTKFKSPITLGKIKSKSFFKDWYLVRIGRLGFMPVSTEQWNKIISWSK